MILMLEIFIDEIKSQIKYREKFCSLRKKEWMRLLSVLEYPLVKLIVNKITSTVRLSITLSIDKTI